MTARVMGLERSLLALFVASGFAGLIYQSIWSHYLGLTLGHAAYAQTLVLAIFMGGMALGAWLVARYGAGWRRLILAYAVVELAIGVAGLLFHAVFVAYTGFSQDTVYPALSDPAAVRAWQWGTAALLIAPQTTLLGMTFPLMSGGYLRIAPRADGEILGGLYFTNSIGAAFGALAATFLLLPWVGMPGAMLVAGGINLVVAALAWRLSRRADAAATPAPGPAAGSPDVDATPVASFRRLMLAAAAVTGASSFVYEIGWVRMLNQALGTTVHAFELMLAAFILGLAFGGWWIRRNSHRIGDVVAYAGYAQIAMGIAALVSIPVFGQSFRWVGAMVAALPKTDGGYALFSVGSGAIALLVMFPAAFFAGMTLPLFTMALLRRGHGETSIGRVYAANTLGAIVGVFVAVHLLIPHLGLGLAVTLAALADIALGAVLLRHVADVPSRRLAPLLLGTGIVLAGSLVFGRTDPLALASGVFRTGHDRLAAETRIQFLRDGKTATVAVFSQGTVGTIATNGKPDAALEADPAKPASADEATMLMAAALPLAIHPSPREIAVIGWGSGMTTHTLLGSRIPQRVDSIEIERAMVEGARVFGTRVERGYDDPRSHVHIDDARTYFSTGRKRYDVIVSEPSNPWVSGVSALFTRQFYGFVGRHLDDDGLLVQWLHSYELDDALMATMLAALLTEFPHVEVYLTNSADLLFVASRRPLPPLDAGRLAEPALRAELGRLGLVGAGDYAARRIGSEDLVHGLVALAGAEPYSDFHPVVALKAPAARFMGRAARRPMDLAFLGMPVLEFSGGLQPVAAAQPVHLVRASTGSEYHWLGRQVRDALLASSPDPQLARADPSVAQLVEELLRRRRGGDLGSAAGLQAVAVAAELTLARLPAEDLHGLWIEPSWLGATPATPALAAALAAYDAAARRAPAEMQARGLAALEAAGADAPPLLRQQLLTIALLGAYRTGGFDAVRAIEDTHGRGVPAAAPYGLARVFLLTRADTAMP